MSIFDQYQRGWQMGEGMAQQKKKSTLASLMQQAHGAPREQRQGIIGQALGIDQDAGMAMQKQFDLNDEASVKVVVDSSRLLNATPEPMRAQIYKTQIQPRLQALGYPAPPEYTPEVSHYAQQIARAWGDVGSGSASLNEFRTLTADLSPEEVEQARRVRLGLAPRAVTGAARTLTVDIDGVPTQVTFDPTTKTVTPATMNGAPIVGRPKEVEAAAVRSAESGVDLQYKPAIEGATTNARIGAEVANAPAVAQAGADAAGMKARAEAEAQRTVEAPKRIKGYEQALTAAGSVTTSIDSALKLVGPTTTGTVGAAARIVRGSPAYNLAAELETVKANLGFDRLQQMRDNSPTGGALGAVAIQELVALQSTIASLDPNQSAEQLKRNLQRVKTHYENWQKTVRQAIAEERSRTRPAAHMGNRQIKRTGTHNGRRVVQYSDGSIEYAD